MRARAYVADQCVLTGDEGKGIFHNAGREDCELLHMPHHRFVHGHAQANIICPAEFLINIGYRDHCERKLWIVWVTYHCVDLFEQLAEGMGCMLEEHVCRSARSVWPFTLDTTHMLSGC